MNADLTLQQLADAYMASYAGRDRSRGRYVAEWCKVLGERRLPDLDADAVAEAIERYASTPAQRFLGRDKATGAPRYKLLGLRKPASINRCKSVLSAVLTWGKRKRLLPRSWANPCRDIPAEPERNARVRFLSTAERERLLKVARVSAWPRLYLLVLMALSTGARRGELSALRFRHLDLEAGTAHVQQTKNGSPRMLPLVPAVVAEIKRLPMPHPDAYVFGSRYDMGRPAHFDTAWRKAMALAELRDFRFHDLRHSCASYLAQSGATLLEIADVLGHRQLDVTRRYSHLTVDHKRQLVHRVLGQIQ